MSKCTTLPSGWECTREAGHNGPCAALPVEVTPAPRLHPKQRTAILHRIGRMGDITPVEISSHTLAAIIYDAGLHDMGNRMAELENGLREVDAPALEALVKLACLRS
jgi:hypothetical protein